MIKTLFASACVLACCMGNDYPANAYGFHCKGDSACMNEAGIRQNELNNMQREMEYQRHRDMDELRFEMQQRSY
jgi:hypothetical protein